MREDYTTYSHYITHTFLFKRLGECTFMDLGVTGSRARARFNPFTPKRGQLHISPAASPEILHHALWRTCIFIAYSDERWSYYQFLTTSLKNAFTRFLSLEVKGLNFDRKISRGSQLRRYRRICSTSSLLTFATLFFSTTPGFLRPG